MVTIDAQRHLSIAVAMATASVYEDSAGLLAAIDTAIVVDPVAMFAACANLMSSLVSVCADSLAPTGGTDRMRKEVVDLLALHVASLPTEPRQ